MSPAGRGTSDGRNDTGRGPLPYTADRRGMPDPRLTRARAQTVFRHHRPEGLRGSAVAAAVADRGYTIATGYGALKERTVRIGHMGTTFPTPLSGYLEVVGRLGQRLENERLETQSLETRGHHLPGRMSPGG